MLVWDETRVDGASKGAWNPSEIHIHADWVVLIFVELALDEVLREMRVVRRRDGDCRCRWNLVVQPRHAFGGAGVQKLATHSMRVTHAAPHTVVNLRLHQLRLVDPRRSDVEARQRLWVLTRLQPNLPATIQRDGEVALVERVHDAQQAEHFLELGQQHLLDLFERRFHDETLHVHAVLQCAVEDPQNAAPRLGRTVSAAQDQRRRCLHHEERGLVRERFKCHCRHRWLWW